MLRQKLPRVMNGVALEIVAEAEIAEHLEECVVARRIADIFQIVVLSARAHAALRGRRAHVWPLVDAEEHVLELHHPGIGEEQRRIVGRNERRARHVRVPLRHEVINEPAADCGDLHGTSESGLAGGDKTCPRIKALHFNANGAQIAAGHR